MANLLKTAVIADVGNLPIDAFTVQAGRKIIVIGCTMTNKKDTTVLGNVYVKDPGSVTAYYAKDIILPPNGSARIVNGGEKLVLDENHTLQFSSTFADSVDVIVSYAEQS
jgi:hypothetical protein